MIIVKGRELLIPENERYIGTTYDDNSTVRTFRIPRFSEDGMDKSQLDFYLIFNYDNGYVPSPAGVVKSVSDDYIVLEWDVNEDITEHSGCLFAWVRGFDYTGAVRWSSFPGVFYVETSGTEPTDLSDLEQRISEEDKLIRLAKLYKTQPMTAATVAEMVNRDRVYVYVGNEAGYIRGNWYFWDGSAWTSGGVYNAVAVQTDQTLTQENMAADAKAVGAKKIQRYDTVAAMKADTSLNAGVYVRTGGYYAVNDGGSALYKIETAQPSTHYESLTNGLYAELIFDDVINIRQLGARPSTSSERYDIASYLTEYIGILDAVVNKVRLFIPAGIWLTTPVTLARSKGFDIFGEHPYAASTTPGTVISSYNDPQTHVIQIGDESVGIMQSWSMTDICISSADNFASGIVYKVISDCAMRIKYASAGRARLYFNYIGGTALAITSSWENYFKVLNFRHIYALDSEVLRLENFDSTLTRSANISATSIDHMMFEAVHGTLIHALQNCRFVNSDIGIINVEDYKHIPVWKNGTDMSAYSYTNWDEADEGSYISQPLFKIDTNATVNVYIACIALNNFSTYVFNTPSSKYVYNTVINNASVKGLVTVDTVTSAGQAANIVSRDGNYKTNVTCEHLQGDSDTYTFSDLDYSISLAGSGTLTKARIDILGRLCVVTVRFEVTAIDSTNPNNSTIVISGFPAPDEYQYNMIPVIANVPERVTNGYLSTSGVMTLRCSTIASDYMVSCVYKIR